VIRADSLSDALAQQQVALRSVADPLLAADGVEVASHRADIASTLAFRSPSLAGQVSDLLASGREATEAVRAALDKLRADDPFLWEETPSIRLYATLLSHHQGQRTPGSAAQRWACHYAQADRASVDERRREAYRLKRALLAAGKAIPTEEDTTNAPQLDPAWRALGSVKSHDNKRGG
jgi:hypothetical protein